MAGVALTAVVAAGLGLNGLGSEGDPEAGSGAPGPVEAAVPSGPLEEAAAADAARASGEPVEVTALTTATSTTVALPEGGFELTSYSVPVRVNVDGEWTAVDTALEPTEDGGGWVPAATNHPVVFHGGSGEGRASRTGRQSAARAQDGQDTGGAWYPLVTLAAAGQHSGHEVTMSWPQPLPEPVIEGPSALYREVLAGVDLLLTARDSGFSHVLIVKTQEAARNPDLAEVAYRLTSPTLDFEADAETQVVRALDADGREVAASPSPFMWDSAAKPAVTEGTDAQPEQPARPPRPAEVGPDYDPPAAPEDAARQAAYASQAAGAGAGEVFALPGLDGPQPGTHDAVAALALDEDGVVTLTPDGGLLTGQDTVFPVFIDPSWTAGTNNWTFAYDRYPTTSFWNGQNFNNGTDTARVGYESTTHGTSRAFFQLDWDPGLQGAAVSSASFYGLNTYSWSCTGKRVELWKTGGIGSGTTWDNQPSWAYEIDAKTTAHGYSGSCPDDWIEFDATGTAQDAADNGWSTITVGLRAGSESSSHYWKKFQANSSNSPYLKATYNRRPTEPTAQAMSPGPDCDTGGTSVVGNSDLTFAAEATDADGNLKYLDFELWEDGNSSDKIRNTNVTTDADGRASITVNAAEFTDGTTYWWRVRAIDSSGAVSSYAPPGTDNCGFVYDGSRPNPPKITSTDFPEATDDGRTWSGVPFGESGSVTFGADGTSDTVEYEYSVNSTAYGNSIGVSPGGSTTVALAPPYAGPNVLNVRAVDDAGNISTVSTYLFYVSPRDATDTAGDTTGDGYPDLFVINNHGNLELYNGDSSGDVYKPLDGAHRNGNRIADGYWTDPDGIPALITHNGDFVTGDGLTDLVARMPDKDGDPDNGLSPALFIYPGDGYGSVDVARRQEILLPDNAPDAAALNEIRATGDITGDGLPDMFAVRGDQLWAFTGYTGGAFAEALLLCDGAWDSRDIVTVDDVSGNGVADMIFRTHGGGNLYLREGIANAEGTGVDLSTLAYAGTSAQGGDTRYATGDFKPADHPIMMGTPDVNADGVPDFWTLHSTGAVYAYRATSTSVGSRITVKSGWQDQKAFG